MATVAFPSANAVGGDDRILEASMSDYMGAFYELPLVKSGFTGGTSGTLTLTIAAGTALVAGRRMQETSSITRALPGSSTRDVYYQLTLDGSNNVTSAALTDVAAGAAAPSNSVLLGTAVTSGSAITTWTDKRPLAGSPLIGQGTHASRPATPSLGTLYWSTDRGKAGQLSRYDGSAWRWIGPLVQQLDYSGETLTVNNTAAATDYMSYTIPANLIEAGDEIRWRVWGDILLSSGSPTITWTATLGGTSMFTSPANTLATSANRREWIADGSVLFRLTNDERVAGVLHIADDTADTWTVSETNYPLVGTNAIVVAMTSAQALKLTATMSVANAANEIRRFGYSIYLHRTG